MSDYNKPQNYDVYGESDITTRLAASQDRVRTCGASRLWCAHVRLRQTWQMTDLTHTDYNPTTRSEHGPDYATFGAQPTYTSQYVGAQAQVPSGLPQTSGLSMVPSAQQYSGPHDPNYNPHDDQQYSGQHPAYFAAPPRAKPEIISWSPQQGAQGTNVTVHFRSIYDFDNPSIQAFLMFGSRKCQSILQKDAAQHSQMYQYALSAQAPTPNPNSPSRESIHLLFDDSIISWESPTIELGDFYYVDLPSYQYAADSPQATAKSLKRKLSPQPTPRHSPIKRLSQPQFVGPSSRTLTAPYPNTLPATTPSSPFRRPSLPEAYQQSRRVSTDYPQVYSAPISASQYQYGSIAGQATPSLQPSQSPSWTAYQQSVQSVTRSPSAAAVSVGGRSAHLLPSPAGSGNPQLVRTSTLQQSPTAPASAASFNPYAMYPSNTKAILKLDGELSEMTKNWTKDECEVQRRLVQFRRSQTGSVITATFEAVTPETRAPPHSCVSCIWWEDKGECFVTSVDTIQLLEALVAVRFTVEEKNRIRRNLEGFRPATVSKAKQDSEEFFKLIMGFPSPKPRNIEKDVKVFPWRVLATALKKIIGKYACHPQLHCIVHDACIVHTSLLLAPADHTSQSASYSSTAGALHSAVGPSYAGRGPDAGIDTVGIVHTSARPTGASPQSTSSSATSHAAAYATTHQVYHTATSSAYSPHAGVASAGLGMGPSGALPAAPTDMRLSVPGPAVSAAGQTTSWHQPSAHYTTDVAAIQQPGRSAWDYNQMMGSAPTGMPGTVTSYGYSYQQQSQLPSLTGQSVMPTEGRFVPLPDYDQQSHPTSTA
jgi:hypothetical protein